jgi:MoaA/NifB/PqqE/SkfB family radical SAM enzyme
MVRAQRVSWMMTYWCQNSCPYCGLPVRRTKKAVRESGVHAFAVQPVERWLKCFGDLFDREQTYLNITGGEPFLDRPNFRDLLSGLLSHTNLAGLRINTSGFFSPWFFRDIPKEKIYLNVSYHPTQVALSRFIEKLCDLRDHGFDVTQINYVLAPGQYERFEAVREELEGMGFFVNACPMIPAGKYLRRTERDEVEAEIIKKYNPPIDAKYRLSPVSTRGRLCGHPCKSYLINFDGKLQVDCLGPPVDFFSGEIPELPPSPVPCPKDSCTGCYEMYRELLDEPYTPPEGVFGLPRYVEEVKIFRGGNTRAHSWRAIDWLMRRFTDKRKENGPDR